MSVNPAIYQVLLCEVPAENLRVTRRGKLECPACKHTGWGAHWWHAHRRKQHTYCTGCGNSFVSLSKHLLRGCPASKR